MMTGSTNIAYFGRLPRQWVLSAVLAGTVHAAAVAAMLWHPDVAPSDGGSPVVLMELAPVPVSPDTTPINIAPGAVQLQPASEERTKAESERKPEKITDDKIEVPTSPSNAPFPVPVAEPIKRPSDTPTAALKQTASAAIPEPSAPPAAVQPAVQAAGPAPGQAAGPSAQVIAIWQRQLVVHLQKFKRYPQNAKGAQGIATVSFAIDRAGRVTHTRIIESSGSSVLDAEAIANIRRAEPFPMPPKDTVDALLSFSVPIRYLTAGR